jgi:hypothetical protein
MRRVKDFVPRREKEFKHWSDNFITKLGEIITESLMPIETYRVLVRLHDDYNSKYKFSETPETRTSATVLARQEARTVYEKELRLAVKAYLNYSPNLTNKQRNLLGLNIHKTDRTPIGLPTEPPSMKVKVRTTAQLIVQFQQQRPGEKDPKRSLAKPYGMDGAIIKYDVLPEKPADHTEFRRHVFATRTPYIMNFPMVERSKTAYFVIAWVNEKGEVGPYSSVVSEIIP